MVCRLPHKVESGCISTVDFASGGREAAGSTPVIPTLL